MGPRNWTPDLAAKFLRMQALELSHHVGDLDLTKVVDRCWDLAHFYVCGTVDDAQTHHLVVQIAADLAREPEYVSIFEEGQPESVGIALAHRHCREICGVVGGRNRNCVDGDYSPSKPLTKTARRSGVAASLFAGHP